MLNMKKALIAGAVLTALAATAFAAEVDNAKPAATDNANRICQDNDCHPGHHKFHKGHGMQGEFQRPRMTPEEREKFKAMSFEERKAFMKARHEEWIKNMTPEQKARYEQRKAQMKERMEAHKKMVEEKMSKLTPEQRAEVQQFIKDDMAQRKAMGERIRKMTPEQRDALRAVRPDRFGFHHHHHHHGPMGAPAASQAAK